MANIQNILFICYANTCRSPGAEYLARHYAKKYNLREVTFSSAGWHDAFDHAQPETIDYVYNKNIDMSNFRPRTITRELLETHDLIIGMERFHLMKVKHKFRDLREGLKDKMYTLKQFNGAVKKDHNIPDPYMTGFENYNHIMKIVDENVEKLVLKIKEINAAD